MCVCLLVLFVPVTGASRRYAFVEFADRDDARAAQHVRRSLANRSLCVLICC